MMELLQNGIDIKSIVGNVWYFVLILVVFDIVVGLLASASEHKISSNIKYRGIIKKVGIFIGLGFVTFMDIYLQTYGVLTKIYVGMIVAYEVMSIIENFSRIGIKMDFLTKYFDPEKVGKGNKK